MVNTEYTDITLLLDRSGSMSAIKTDMDGAMKEFIDEQRKVDKPCTINAYQFDAVCETIYEGMDIQKVDAPKIIPRDFTALTMPSVKLLRELEHDWQLCEKKIDLAASSLSLLLMAMRMQAANFLILK